MQSCERNPKDSRVFVQRAKDTVRSERLQDGRAKRDACHESDSQGRVGAEAGDSREEKDKMIPLRTLARLNYSADLYDIVDSCLAVDRMRRPQTAFDLQKRLMEEPPEEKRGFLDTINKPLSKLFSR